MDNQSEKKTNDQNTLDTSNQISPETPTQVTLSKDVINILVQLINIAQKRGAYTIEESYLAYKVFRSFLNDPKFDKIEELANTLK